MKAQGGAGCPQRCPSTQTPTQQMRWLAAPSSLNSLNPHYPHSILTILTLSSVRIPHFLVMNVSAATQYFVMCDIVTRHFICVSLILFLLSPCASVPLCPCTTPCPFPAPQDSIGRGRLLQLSQHKWAAHSDPAQVPPPSGQSNLHLQAPPLPRSILVSSPNHGGRSSSRAGVPDSSREGGGSSSRAGGGERDGEGRDSSEEFDSESSILVRIPKQGLQFLE